MPCKLCRRSLWLDEQQGELCSICVSEGRRRMAVLFGADVSLDYIASWLAWRQGLSRPEMPA